MKYCSYCGETLIKRIPEGDDIERLVCAICERVHYQNPRLVLGCLPVAADERVLLCLRSIEPRRDFWTLPAGYMEENETTREGALRETREEARAEVRIDDLHGIFDLPHINQVYMFFRASLLNKDYGAGHETREVRLFDEAEIPWDRLAFPVVEQTLRDYFDDRRRGVFHIRQRTVDKSWWRHVDLKDPRYRDKDE